jgi:methionyl-tRNA formyltransferase
VVTAPDKPAGRGYALTPPPVKTAAQALGVPVHQPASLKEFDPAPVGPVDFGLVVAYGRLIPRRLFAAPRFGLVNVHFSLLPKYRGAGPVQWTLIRGEKTTGVTLFQIDAGLDTGPIYLQREEPIRPDDNSQTLRGRLAERGLALVDELLAGLEAGTLKPRPQAGDPSAAPLLKKEDGLLRWDEFSAEEAANRVRGAYEWPGAYALWKGQRLKVRAAAPAAWETGRPGEIVGVEKDRGVLVKCRTGALLLRDVQPEGKKPMPAWDFANGARLSVGAPLA